MPRPCALKWIWVEGFDKVKEVSQLPGKRKGYCLGVRLKTRERWGDTCTSGPLKSEESDWEVCAHYPFLKEWTFF